jgi:RNA polymerase sigma-70 factor (ECF subfamily)
MTALEFQHSLVKLEDNLKRFAYSLTSDKEEAKDLMQETYLKALVYRDKFVHYDNLKAWTFTIMKNTFINNYRRSARQNANRDLTRELYYLNQSVTTGNDDPNSAYSRKEIEKKIDLLEDEFRIPFQMHNKGFKYKEIADELNLNIGTVKSRIFFSRKKLMESLKDYQ